MIKEAKNIDFYTTGKQPSEHDFARITEWIKKDKLRRKPLKSTNQATKQNKCTLTNRRLCAGGLKWEQIKIINNYSFTEMNTVRMRAFDSVGALVFLRPKRLLVR